MSYEHKDTPESFWERMRAIHGEDIGPPIEPVDFCSKACRKAQECCFDDCPYEEELLQ